MNSEFKQFLDILRRLGIEHTVNYGPTKKDWQRAIVRAGYDVTALGCSVIEVGSQQFLFCNGQLQWDDEENGHGPFGLFMLSRDKRTRRTTNRRHYNLNHGSLRPGTGLKAAQSQYPISFGLASF